MGHYSFNELEPPEGKHREILSSVLHVDPEHIKKVNCCTGLGFGKTVLGIQAAVLALNYDGNQVGLFLEPDHDRIDTIFLPEWERLVPSALYEIDYGKKRIRWYNGSVLYYRARVITGSKARNRNKFRGLELTFVIDDETAVGFDMETYQNIFARIRRKSDIRFFLTLSTPQVGPYGRFLKTKGAVLFQGRTRDNRHLPKGYEQQQRENMSEDQARRELDGELVALEGRIWKDFDAERAWPNGNVHHQHSQFDPSKPWWLACDLGSANGAYGVVQQTDPVFMGERLFGSQVWVIVADLCPQSDASASRAFQRLKKEFGAPAGVVAGADVNTRSSGDGKTIAYFARQIWSNVRIYPCDESMFSKQIQYDRMSYMVKSAIGQRRLCVAKNFVSLDMDSRRGVIEMFDEDAWPEESKRRQQDFLPKNKDCTVQHIRDALLMLTVQIMSPPEWRHTKEITA